MANVRPQTHNFEREISNRIQKLDEPMAITRAKSLKLLQLRALWAQRKKKNLQLILIYNNLFFNYSVSVGIGLNINFLQINMISFNQEEFHLRIVVILLQLVYCLSFHR